MRPPTRHSFDFPLRAAGMEAADTVIQRMKWLREYCGSERGVGCKEVWYSTVSVRSLRGGFQHAGDGGGEDAEEEVGLWGVWGVWRWFERGTEARHQSAEGYEG